MNIFIGPSFSGEAKENEIQGRNTENMSFTLFRFSNLKNYYRNASIHVCSSRHQF